MFFFSLGNSVDRSHGNKKRERSACISHLYSSLSKDPSGPIRTYLTCVEKSRFEKPAIRVFRLVRNYQRALSALAGSVVIGYHYANGAYNPVLRARIDDALEKKKGKMIRSSRWNSRPFECSV